MLLFSILSSERTVQSVSFSYSCFVWVVVLAISGRSLQRDELYTPLATSLVRIIPISSLIFSATQSHPSWLVIQNHRVARPYQGRVVYKLGVLASQGGRVGGRFLFFWGG